MKRRLSIKARVTLWYTGLLVVLVALALGYLLAFSDGLSTRQVRETLLDAVSDAVRETRFEHGELEEREIDFYRDGVSIFLYDTNGYLLAPRINRGIQVDSVLEDGTVRVVRGGAEEWMVHDLYAVKDGAPFWVRGVASMTGPMRTLRNMRLLAAIGGPVFLLIAAAGGYALTRRAFSPVAEIARTADAVSSGSDLSQRVPDDGSGDELSRLGRTVNTMLERLQASFEHERQFTSDVSHELRTPAAVIISQCEYALSGAADGAEREECLRACLRQARRMSGIIAQLLLFSRADNGRLALEREPVDLGEVCEMVSLEMQDSAREAGLTLRTRLASGVMVTGDETLIIRLLGNLITNAIRYNRPGGSIDVTLEREAGSAVLRVADTGIGIPAGELPKIWNRFYRADASRSGEGEGLGLPMVRLIARLHGGEADAESTPGAGSVFRVTLPL